VGFWQERLRCDRRVGGEAKKADTTTFAVNALRDPLPKNRQGMGATLSRQPSIGSQWTLGADIGYDEEAAISSQARIPAQNARQTRQEEVDINSADSRALEF
jgi:hypothetical protein